MKNWIASIHNFSMNNIISDKVKVDKVDTTKISSPPFQNKLGDE